MSAETHPQPGSTRLEHVGVTDHADEMWAERSPERETPPQEAWRDAEPVDYPSMKPPARHARYHEPSGMLLLASADGALVTTFPLWNRSRREQQHIESQVTDL